MGGLTSWQSQLHRSVKKNTARFIEVFLKISLMERKKEIKERRNEGMNKQMNQGRI